MWSWWNPPPPRCSTLEVYEETTIFIPVDITENVVKLVTRKLLGGSGPGGTDSENLQGWLLQFGEYRKRLCTSVEIFIDWIANQILTWASYRTFISGRLIALNKWPGVCKVGLR